jgi:alcohol dehydrogenase class IV
VVLPYVMTFNKDAIQDKCARIARAVNLPGDGYGAVYAWVLALRRQIGIPNTLAELGVSLDQAGVIGKEAAIDPSAAGNPVPVGAPELERIFRSAVRGELPAA